MNKVNVQDLGYEPGDLEVQVSELLVATADDSDELIEDAVPEVLRLLREKMQMDVVFVSEFTGGRRVFRHVNSLPQNDLLKVGASDPLEESWCQRVVDGRMPPYIVDASKEPASAPLEKALPFRIGTHISAPIVLKDGEVYGTLCCFSFSPVDNPDPKDLKRLQYTAQLTAGKIDKEREVQKKRTARPSDQWGLAPQ
ncbi:MAG: GAF domain-containing protein [Pseudomonadota bacterium]